MALARLRAVRPQDLQALGLILPGIFLSNNFKQDVPSVDFSKMLDEEPGDPARGRAVRAARRGVMQDGVAGTTPLFE